ncbi:hypothetical protein KKA13_01315 [Patescibacteria group bacterium]|nr:hypothetical protein [Patescibacteria group bacterium]
MSSTKKILFISCSAGMGHVRAAEALRLSVLKNYPNITAEHIDMAKYSTAPLKYSSTSGYASLVRHLPKIYGSIYHALDAKLQSKIISKLNFLFKINSKKLLKFIDDFKPDQIVCTHFLAALPLKKYFGKVPISMVVTDYTAHKLWLSPFVSEYFVANEGVKKMLGADKDNIFVVGLPIQPSFFEEKNIEELKKNLGIKNDWRTILLMAGGFGLIDIAEAVKNILKEMEKINVVAVSGKNNEKLFEKLNKISKTDEANLIVLKFTDKIDEWMRVADVIVTKPGGITVAECLSLQKPLLLVDPIPGQEDANVEYVEKNNFGREVKNVEDLPELIKNVFNAPNYFSKPPRMPDACEEILKQILN